MSWRSRVAWSQGMFLQPQHFQQEMRAIERILDAARGASAPFGWGFSRLEIDEAALGLGRIAIAQAAGIMPDGTPFSIPALDPPPAPLEIGAEVGNELICLAVPMVRQGAVEFDLGDAGDPALARFRAQAIEARDQTNGSAEAVTIQVGALNARLLRGKEATDAYAVLGVARVKEKRPDLQLVLDRTFIPSQFVLNATEHLTAYANALRGLLAQRADALAGRMGQLSHGVSELADFLMLQTVNRHEPWFAQAVQLGRHHPQALYEECLCLAGDLATLLHPKRRAPAFPVYRHDDLAATFAPVIGELRRMLSMVLEQNAVPIDLAVRSHGIRTATIADADLLRRASFVLAVNAAVPGEQLRSRFLVQGKIGPVERIRDLVNLQLPGIVARPLPVAPRQLPFHTGFHYFELERGSDLWKQFEKVGNLAIHMPGDLPELEMQLWAIRPS